ncbi:MAG TPA: hypothetical protein VJH34_02375 [archaeon]|nr:hypothetical protein [archaeon]
MTGMPDTIVMRDELNRAKRELFMVSNIRELKMIQNRISFLSQQLRTMNKKH